MTIRNKSLRSKLNKLGLAHLQLEKSPSGFYVWSFSEDASRKLTMSTSGKYIWARAFSEHPADWWAFRMEEIYKRAYHEAAWMEKP